MTSLDIIKEIHEFNVINQGKSRYPLEFQPGLSEKELESLKTKFPGNQIDDELLEILKFTRGWNCLNYLGLVYFDSIGAIGAFSPFSLTLGHDGAGNFWILDIGQDGKLGKVFYACHDPAEWIIHSQSLKEYLLHLKKNYEKPNYPELNANLTGFEYNEYCHTKIQFLKDHPEYADFLGNFEGDDWTVADLRKGENTMGFDWGRASLKQAIQRHHTDLLWVFKNKKKGFLSRLLGW